MSDDSPTDETWEVGIVWLTRHLERPDRMLSRRVHAARAGRKPPRATSERSRAGDALDAATGCTDLGDAPALLAILAVVVIAGAFVALGPGLLAITVGLLEIALVLVGAAIALIARVVFRQPWEIVARRDGRHHEWRVRGIRRARSVLTEVENGLRLGHDPATIATRHIDPGPPDLSGVPGLYRRPEFRLLGRVYGLLLAGALLVGLALVGAALT